MEMLIQTIVSGLATGSLYGLAALGLVLIYNTSGLINFAQGEIGMFSTFIAFVAIFRFSFPWVGAVLLALLFAIVLGVLVEKVLIRPIQQEAVFSRIIMTLGLYMVLNGMAGFIWGYDARAFPALLQGPNLEGFGIVLSQQSLLVFFVAAAIAFGLYFIFKYSMLGIAMRAAAQDMVATTIMGVKTRNVFSATWAMASILSVVAGILLSPQIFLEPNMMLDILMKAMASAVIGGFNSMPGAILGGLLLGTSENLISAYVSTDLKSTFSFSLIILVLVIKPSGLFSKAAEKKV
jgi:branched-chain amino acid transport system permease protein